MEEGGLGRIHEKARSQHTYHDIHTTYTAHTTPDILGCSHSRPPPGGVPPQFPSLLAVGQTPGDRKALRAVDGDVLHLAAEAQVPPEQRRRHRPPPPWGRRGLWTAGRTVRMTWGKNMECIIVAKKKDSEKSSVYNSLRSTFLLTVPLISGACERPPPGAFSSPMGANPQSFSSNRDPPHRSPGVSRGSVARSNGQEIKRSKDQKIHGEGMVDIYNNKKHSSVICAIAGSKVVWLKKNT